MKTKTTPLFATTSLALLAIACGGGSGDDAGAGQSGGSSSGGAQSTGGVGAHAGSAGKGQVGGAGNTASAGTSAHGGGGGAGQGGTGSSGSAGKGAASGGMAGSSGKASAGGSSGSGGKGGNAGGGASAGGGQGGSPGAGQGGNPSAGQGGNPSAGKGGSPGAGQGGGGQGGTAGGGQGGAPLTDVPPDCAYEGPLTIDDTTPSSGGVITISNRCFRRDQTTLKSDGVNTEPVISIKTKTPVVIDHCIVVGAGRLIDASEGGATDVIVRHTQGYGLTPTVDGVPHGEFFFAYGFLRAEIEHSYLSHTSGIHVWVKSGDGSDGRSVRVVANVVREIDGRHKDVTMQSNANFVGFNAVQARNVEIAWNEVVNTPGLSAVEDNIGLYRAGGFADSPLLIHDNFIRGGWPIPVDSSTWTGSGVTTDGDLAHATESAWVQATHNVFVGVPMNIAIGSHHRFVDNTYLSSGLMPDGQKISKCYWCVGGIFNYYQSDPALFTDNKITGFTIGLNQQPFLPVSGASEGNSIDGTVLLPGPITVATEDEANVTFRKAALAASVTLGP